MKLLRINESYSSPTAISVRAMHSLPVHFEVLMPGPNAHGSPYRVQSVFDALALIEMLIARNRPMSASQAADVLNDSRNRTFRLLKTLEECGYVIHSPVDKTYRPSLKLLTLGQAVSKTLSIESLSRGIMAGLGEAIGETVYLCTREGLESVCVATIESSQMVRITAQPGMRWPLGRGASGTALLVSAPEEVVNRYLANDPDKLSIYQKVKKQYERDGVTFVDGRDGTIQDEGVLAISAPIHDASSNANYALAVAWPYTRSSADFAQIREALLEATAAIERHLGVPLAADQR
jgi:DNA-binding IclR family transcriptional regulator